MKIIFYYRIFMRCDAMRCDAMRCDAMRCDAMRFIFSKLNIIFIVLEAYHIYTLCQAFFILILKYIKKNLFLMHNHRCFLVHNFLKLY
ncbi:hypothetical protein [uncultured Brachyspira sp.]|uniref:hypothetical protein n=1 Tax=uncultured Brachyspira sp. TaxID=221953 RepID=UPI0025EE27B6|nr:hypothetical protein [uncultured Brachyspira sp.]